MTSWHKIVLDKIPHGEDGWISNLTFEEASAIGKILVDKHYAICIIDGAFKETYDLRWIYAGDDGEFGSYKRIVFTNTDYLYDYPEALREESEEEE